jgi:hypothetical protein
MISPRRIQRRRTKDFMRPARPRTWRSSSGSDQHVSGVRLANTVQELVALMKARRHLRPLQASRPAGRERAQPAGQAAGDEAIVHCESLLTTASMAGAARIVDADRFHAGHGDEQLAGGSVNVAPRRRSLE